MRVLVTGAAGFLGRNALLALPRAWDIVALHRPGPDILPRFVTQHGLTNVRPVACDLTQAEEVTRTASVVGMTFDHCLYLAGNTEIPVSIAAPLGDLTANAIGLINTLNHWTFDHVVYFSSGAVYIGLRGIVGPESFVDPDLPYAISKWAAEHYVRAFTRRRGTPARATIVRFFGAFGPYEPPRKLYTRLVHRFAFDRIPEYTVVGDGENYIDAMYVDDAMRAVLAMLEQPPDQGIVTVDLGTGNNETVNQVVARAGRAFGLEPRILHAGSSPEYIEFTIDAERFARAYDVRPTVTLEDGLYRLAAHLERECSED